MKQSPPAFAASPALLGLLEAAAAAVPRPLSRGFFRGNRRRRRRLHSGTRQGRPCPFRHQPRHPRRPRLRGRRYPHSLHDPVDVKALRVRAGAGHAGRGAGGERHRRRTVRRSLQFDPAQCRQPSLQRDGQRRRDHLHQPDPRGQGRRRVRIHPPGARPVCRARPRRRRGRVCLRKRHRRPQPRHCLSAAHLSRHQAGRRRGAGDLFPAMRRAGHRARHRRDGRDARQPRRQSRHRRAGHDALRDFADAVGDDQFRHVRLCRRMDLPRRHPRQERRRRRHPGGAAGAARARQLFAETRQPRQQRARHQGLRGAVAALRPAYAQPQRRRPQQHHRRLRHREKSVAAQPSPA